MTKAACNLFHDDLAAVLDGDEATLERHLDHLADCDDCRDLRHEASSTIVLVAEAGADYVIPAEMAERVLSQIDAVPIVDAAPENTAEAPRQSPAALGATEVAPVAAQVPPATNDLSRQRAKQPPKKPVVANKSGKSVVAMFSAAALAAAAGLAVYVGTRDGSDSTSENRSAMSATVAHVDDVGGAGGLSYRQPEQDEFVVAAADAKVPAGSLIRTDNRTRARLVLSDGSEITLNQGTEVELRADHDRGIQLHTGELVAEVAHLDNGPNATYTTPNAAVEVLGTRFLLAVGGDYTSVRVTRGLVALSSDGGRTEVRPGEEGIAAANAAPEVFPSGRMAEAMSFAEMGDGPNDSGDGSDAMAGIGELRAYKPGEKRDRDWKLKIEKQTVNVRIAGNIARTEIEQTFRNDSKTTLEGVYKFPLPSDAKIERLALDVATAENGFEEGAFVDKERAAKIWRGVIRKATLTRARPREPDVIWVPGPWKDPALLEWQRGGQFELRIFPIPKKGSRTIKLAYTQVLAPQGSHRRYVYPLAYAKDGSTSVENFELDVRVRDADQQSPPRVLGYPVSTAAAKNATDPTTLNFKQANFQPRGNFIVKYAPQDATAEVRAWTFRGDVAAGPGINSKSKRGGLDPKVAEEQTKIASDKRPTALFALKPKLPRWTELRTRDFVFVIDSSHSMVGDRFAKTRQILAAAVGEMDRGDRISLLACDVDCKVFGTESSVPSAKTAAEVDAWLAAIEPAGASNLGAAIERAGQLAGERRRNDADAWVIALNDGIASMGFRKSSSLARVSKATAAKHQVSISTMAIGSDAEDAVLAEVARAGSGHFVPWRPGQPTGAAALALLETTYGVSLENPTVALPSGLTDIAPAALPTIRSGQEVLIGARFSEAVSGDIVLRGTVAGKPFEQRYPVNVKASESMGNAFVPRMWASLDIAQRELTAKDEDRAKIVAMSKAYGVLSRHTSLLVLESPAMFKAFGVDRSQPNLRWTGDEDVEVSNVGGLLDSSSGLVGGSFGGGKSGLAKGPMAKKSKMAPSRDEAPTAGAEDLARPRPAETAVSDDKTTIAPPASIGRRSRRPGSWMRRVWYRTGTVSTFKQTSSRLIKAVADAEAAHRAEPNSRGKHRALVQALSSAGQIERATEVALKWLERDRFDSEALVYVADALARGGDRSRGLRLLSGVVDIAPDNVAFHERLASAYEHAEQTSLACAHRVAVAEIAEGDANRVGQALRCSRAAGRRGDADWISERTADDVRVKAEKVAAETETDAANNRRSQLSLEASWLGRSDLDISIVGSDGVRMSWMGGRKGLDGANAMTPGRENLSLRRIRPGSYTVEVSRSDASDNAPIEGSVEVKLLRSKRTLNFKLDGQTKRVPVGTLRVRSQSRMVPM